MEFVALDIETANPDQSSICQIGIAKYINGQLVDELCLLIDPEDYFDKWNIDVHGITERMIEGKPTFPEVYEQVAGFLNDALCVTHTHFDRNAIHRVLARYNLPAMNISWLDSAKVTRRTWPELAQRGYGLANVCQKIGYEFKHHDALEDAKASAQVLFAAIEESGLNLDEWLIRVAKPINLNVSYSTDQVIDRAPNPEGDLFGEIIVFTGSLSMPRADAQTLAAQAGCKPVSSVSGKTTLLVVGEQDETKLKGQEKSSSHRKAEAQIAKGKKIRILTESDFFSLIKLT
jgi:DNA polymerase-3 subunit epsilon